MGLLDKALRLRKPSPEKPPAGLLARARQFRDFIASAPKPQGPGLLKRALAFRERPGLFKRAAALRESLGPPELAPAAEAQESARPHGLLQRASSLRTAETPAAESPREVEPPQTAWQEPPQERGGLLQRAERLRHEPLAAPTDSAPILEPDVGDFSGLEGPGVESHPAPEYAPAKPELPGLWNELDEPEDQDFALPDLTQSDASPELSDDLLPLPPLESFDDWQEPAPAEEPLDDFSDEWSLTPDAAEFQSAPEPEQETPAQPSDRLPDGSDTASPEEFWENMDPGDPFSEYEQLAEHEAEQALMARGEQTHPENEEKPLFLFDADDEFITAPVEAHIAGQKKIDHYLSLFDIAREVSAIQDFDEFWDAILFAVMGQLGAQTVAVFAARSAGEAAQVFYPVAVSGFNPNDSWMLKPGDRLYDLCEKEDGVLYAHNLRSVEQAAMLSDMERVIITESGAEIIAPLRNNKRMYGIVLFGPTFSGDEYSIDDLEFITLLGGLASSGVDRILARLEFDRDTETLRRRDFFHNRIMEAARDAASVRGLDDLYDILVRNLTEHFGADSYSLVLLNPSTQEYTLFAGNRISPESMERFRLSTSSELVGMISNFTRVFDVSDFRTNSEFSRCYTNDDLGIMKHYWAVPLIYQNWLVGFFTVHSVRRDWTEFDREMVVSLAELLGPSFGGAIMLGERESLFRDPFSPLEDRLRLELKKCQEFHSHLSLVEIRIKNIKRVLALNPSARVTQFLGAVGRSVAGHLLQTDFLARIGQGRFAVILPGRGKEEAEIFVKKVQSDLKRLNLLPGSPIDAQFVHTIVSAQDTTDPEKMLAILE